MSLKFSEIIVTIFPKSSDNDEETLKNAFIGVFLRN